ncbi:MAG: T9SS type A sorting domain-containing protein [Dysgonamonadaceae bacterium]|jgi:hypothetical protein|nr:T9SS type A sorting domain-containing protein [Dysgonamonadaceae bacterium]
MEKCTFKLLMVALILCLPLLEIVAQPIPISTVEDLRGIGIDADKPMTGSYELMNDIDLSGVNDWTPIGMNTGHTFAASSAGGLTNFGGTFDGKGYAIKNLTYAYDGAYVGGINTTDNLTGGIFGRIAGTVKNLELRNLTITGNCAGALAASLAIATIEQVSVIGCIITGGSEVGGITGRTNNNPQTISNCYVDQATKITGAAKIGGFVGNIYQTGNITFKNCYAAATMESTFEATISGLLGASNGGSVILDSVFVMTQASNNMATGIIMEPFAPDGKILLFSGEDILSADYYACSEYFPSDLYPELYPIEDTDTSHVKSLAELQTEATYTNIGWDFDEIWQIEEGKFPIFKWQKYPGQNAIETTKAEQLWNVTGLNNCIKVTISEPLFLSVYDITGKTLFAAQVNNQVSIPANKGIYILKFRNAGKETIQKLIVK